ncbi:MAG TPA: gamma-glutamyltransferase, partial [Acidimicrobiia bacterium]|nr:gamma-glutamyltransferase [Acidimicrobiia bacterium]
MTHAVVTPHRLSAEAARHVLLAGGNAVDAAIAATAAQGVVAPETCGIGGDLFALVHRPGWDRPRALNASGRAGSNADPDALRSIGQTEIPRDHPLTVTVPGCVNGWAALSDELGALNLADCLGPAIEYAGIGFEVSTEQARAFRDTAPMYRDHPAVREFYPGGEPVARGDLVRRAPLAATLQAIARDGRDAFYRGEPSDEIV